MFTVKLDRPTGVIFSAANGQSIDVMSCTIVGISTTVMNAPVFGKFTTTMNGPNLDTNECDPTLKAYATGTEYRYTWTSTTASKPVDPFSFVSSDGSVSAFQAELLPSGETNTFDSWAAGDQQTEAIWDVKLLLAGVDYAGSMIQETNYKRGTDDCWFPGSRFPALVGITQPKPITVRSGDVSYTDTVGFRAPAIDYYRMNVYTGKPRVPCVATVYQEMKIIFPGGDPKSYPYIKNVLVNGAGVSTATSTRATQSATEAY